MQDRQKELLELLDRSGANLYTLLTRLTLREDIAEELMQELFIKLINSRSFDKAGNPEAYAHRAAINLAFDWRRSRKRNPLRLDQIREPASNDSSALGKLVQAEELDEILNAIGQLKKVPREAFVMRYIQQESYDYIAEQLGKTSHHVRALCSRALNHLREILAHNRHRCSGKETQNVKK